MEGLGREDRVLGSVEIGWGATLIDLGPPSLQKRSERRLPLLLALVQACRTSFQGHRQASRRDPLVPLSSPAPPALTAENANPNPPNPLLLSPSLRVLEPQALSTTPRHRMPPPLPAGLRLVLMPPTYPWRRFLAARMSYSQARANRFCDHRQTHFMFHRSLLEEASASATIC